MSKEVTVKLMPDKTNENLTMSFEELYNSILEEIETYEKLGLLEELMQQKVVLDIVDFKGSVITAYPTLFAGWLESGKVCISGNLEGVYE